MSKRLPRWRQWRDTKKDPVVLHLVELAKMTQTIMIDLAALPWGVRPQLYAVKKDEHGELAQLIGTMPSVDPVCFVNAYDEGWRVPEGTEGLVYVFENVRHFTFDEIMETPEAASVLRKQFERDRPEDVQNDVAYEKFYDETIEPYLPPPTLVPPHMRKNYRAAVVVMRAGYGLLLTLTKDEDDLSVISMDETRIGKLDSSGALYQLLHNIRPESDALSNVKNFKILQEIEALG